MHLCISYSYLLVQGVNLFTEVSYLDKMTQEQQYLSIPNCSLHVPVSGCRSLSCHVERVLSCDPCRGRWSVECSLQGSLVDFAVGLGHEFHRTQVQHYTQPPVVYTRACLNPTEPVFYGDVPPPPQEESPGVPSLSTLEYTLGLALSLRMYFFQTLEYTLGLALSRRKYFFQM